MHAPARWSFSIASAPRSTCIHTSIFLDEGLGRLGTRLIGAHTLYFVLWICSWWLLGRGVLEGHLIPGWLHAWVLVLLTYPAAAAAGQPRW
jgi:hypothetical protein